MKIPILIIRLRETPTFSWSSGPTSFGAQHPQTVYKKPFSNANVTKLKIFRKSPKDVLKPLSSKAKIKKGAIWRVLNQLINLRLSLEILSPYFVPPTYLPKVSKTLKAVTNIISCHGPSLSRNVKDV